MLVPRLRAQRQARSWPQSELARRAGVSRQTIRAAEHGRPVTWYTLGRLASALGVSRAELLGEVETP